MTHDVTAPAPHLEARPSPAAWAAWENAVDRSDLQTLYRLVQDGIDLNALPWALRTNALRLVGHHLAMVASREPSSPADTAPKAPAAPYDEALPVAVDSFGLARALLVPLVVAGTDPFTTRLDGLGAPSVYHQAVQAQDPSLGLAMVDAVQQSGQTPVKWALRTLTGSHQNLLLRALHHGWGRHLYDEEDRQVLWCTVVRRHPVGEEPVADLANVQVAHLQALHQHGLTLRASLVLRTMKQVINEVPRLDGETRWQRADRQLRLLTTMEALGMALTPEFSTRLLPRALNQRAPMTLVQHLLNAGANPTGVQDKLIERERIELRETFRASSTPRAAARSPRSATTSEPSVVSSSRRRL